MQYISAIRRLAFICTLFLCVANQAIYAATPDSVFHYVNTVTSLKEAIKDSLAKSKPVFIMYSATWCGYCQAADRDVFSKPEVQKALHDITTLRVDSSDNTPEQVNMMNLYDVQGFPTIIGYDKQGNVTALQQRVSVSSVLGFITQLSK